jgi:serine/threonine protein kinase
LVGVTRGLGYLHNNELVHGDLKSVRGGVSCGSWLTCRLSQPNILIDAEGSPRLSDFGLCSVTKNIDSVNASTPNHGSTVRYCAPELLDVRWAVRVESRKPTYKTDVYSLSMVIVEARLLSGSVIRSSSDRSRLQLATGEMPFPEFTDPNVTILIARGKRPPKPRNFDAPGITPAVWKIARKCWHEKAKERPEVNVVLKHLENLASPGPGMCTYPIWSGR